MKAFGILLLAALVGFAGYQYAYPKLEDWAQLAKLTEPAVTAPMEQPNRVTTIDIPVSKPAEPEPPKPEPKMEPKPEPAPVVMTEPPKKEPSPDEFQPPVFPAIEEVVKNWKEIPKSTFHTPKPIKVRKEIEFAIMVGGKKVGGTKVPAGGQVYAVGQEGDKILVAPAPGSPARAAVAIDDTDLKEILTQAYETWKVSQSDKARKEWEFKRTAKESGVAVNSKSTGAAKADAAGAHKGKPERNADGSYPVLLASMKSGGVTEITPSNIRKWGDLSVQKIDGQEYFTVIVDYTTKTMFGDFTTSAQARIRDGKVVKWIYTGSGEVVP